MSRLIPWLGGWTGSRRNPPRPRQRPKLGVELLEGRTVPAGVSAVYSVLEDWGSGFTGQIQLRNSDPAPVPSWTLEFDFAAVMSSIWDGAIVSRSGNHYVVTHAGWNQSIPGNGAVSFGFVASPGGPAPAPANYIFNGVRLGGDPGPSLPSLSVADVSVAEGNSGTVNANFTISLTAAVTTSVTVQYATKDGTAQAGSDYQAASGSLTFSPGQTQKTVTVRVNGDTAYEPNESFTLELSTPAGAILGRAAATATITNDDAQPPSGGDITFKIVNDWGSGFTGEIAIKNASAAAISDWRLEFDFGVTISSIWNAEVVSRTGNHFVVKNAGWNSTIPAGGTAAFGFVASPGGAVVPPANFKLSSGGSGGSMGNRPPVAVNDLGYGSPGLPITIQLLANDSDPDGDSLTVASVTQPQRGSVTLNGGGTATYSPAAGFIGNDSFQYTISDGKGGMATATVNITIAAPSAWPAHVFAPYVDMANWPLYDLTAVARDQGVRHFMLAFITASPRQAPAWGGFQEYEVNGTAWDLAIRDQVCGVRALGGDVMVSFGGAANYELAQVITDVTALKNAYQSVIDAYQLTHIDFDIEGAAVSDRSSIDRRSQAIAALEGDAAAAGRSLHVWYTLPVLPTGLTADGVYVLQSALRYGVNIAGVNVMAMDYGDAAAPNPQGRMGDYAIQAATSLFAQLKELYGAAKTEAQLWSMVGVTPMIGLNDVLTEVFDQQEARELLAWAQAKGIGFLSMWSLNRDQQHPNGQLNYVTDKASSILQSPFEFSKIFLPFTA